MWKTFTVLKTDKLHFFTDENDSGKKERPPKMAVFLFMLSIYM